MLRFLRFAYRSCYGRRERVIRLDPRVLKSHRRGDKLKTQSRTEILATAVCLVGIVIMISQRESRRTFCQIGLTAAAAVACRPSFAEDKPAKEKNTGWIDAHVHVWTADTAAYPLDRAFKKSDMQPTTFTPEELFAHCRPADVDRIVLIQMSYYGFDNRYMLDVIEQHPGVFSGVAVVNHQAADLPSQVKSLREKGVRGFRTYATGAEARRWLDDPAMQRLWRLSTDHGIAICPLINPGDLPVVDAMCGKNPKTTVVVDHFARIGIDGMVRPKDLDALCALARFPNVYVKTSAFYALGAKQPPYKDLLPMIQRVGKEFGAQRLMWASDCPFQVGEGHTYEASIDLIRKAPESLLTAEDKQWMLRDTAAKVYFG